MATPDLTSANVFDASAALNNDQAKTIYTYTVQLPYLNIALRELQEHFEMNNVPVTNTTSAILTLPVGTTQVGFNTAVVLPTDLIEISQLWESLSGINQWIPMTKKNFLPHYLEGITTSQFIIYTWQNQTINVLPSNQINDIKIDYVSALFTTFTHTDGTDQVNVINAMSFLSYRTAALCAEFIGENKTRADDLNQFAIMGLDRATSISTKGRQSVTTRRRPFRAGFKSRG